MEKPARRSVQWFYLTLLVLQWRLLRTSASSLLSVSQIELLESGDAEYSSGNYAAAAAHYTLALSETSVTPAIYTKRAAAYIKLEEYAKAAMDLELATKAETSGRGAHDSMSLVPKSKPLKRSLISEVQDYTRPSVNSWGLASERHQHITISDWCLNYNRSVIYQAALLDTITPATYELLPESAVPAEQPATTRSATCFNLPQLVEPSAESNGTSHKIVDQVMKGIMSMEDISEDTRERLLRAKSLMDQQDWREASAAVSIISEAQAGYLESLVLQSYCHIFVGEVETAKELLLKAIRLEPNHILGRQAYTQIRDVGALLKRAVQQIDGLASRALKPLDPTQIGPVAWQELAAAEQQILAALATDLALPHTFVHQSLHTTLCMTQLLLNKTAEAVQACLIANDVVTIGDTLPDMQAAAGVVLVHALLANKQLEDARDRAQWLLDTKLPTMPRTRQALEVTDELKQLLHEAQRQIRLLNRKDLHEVLGVLPNTSSSDIKDKYKDLVEAYDILTDDRKHLAYIRGDELPEEVANNGSAISGCKAMAPDISKPQQVCKKCWQELLVQFVRGIGYTEMCVTVIMVMSFLSRRQMNKVALGLATVERHCLQELHQLRFCVATLYDLAKVHQSDKHRQATAPAASYGHVPAAAPTQGTLYDAASNPSMYLGQQCPSRPPFQRGY